MHLSGAAEVAVLILLVATVWGAGAVWIKASDYVEVRRAHRRRVRTREAMRSGETRA